MHQLLIVSLVAGLLSGSSAGLGLPFVPQASQVGTEGIVKMLAPPMMAVAKLITVEKWTPRFDELLQRAPGAESLGGKWSPASPAWPKARAAFTTRMAKILDAYLAYGELPNVLQTTLERDFPGPDAGALWKILNGPTGPSLIEYEAGSEFVLSMMSLTPDGPKVGDPAWMKQLSALRAKFKAGIGPEVPREDPAQQDSVMKITAGSFGLTFSGLWRLVVGKAQNSLDGAINLMIFDDREAIFRDIAQAMATIK
jgi:hypothetical protein